MDMIERRFLEDLAVGEVNATPEIAVSATDIVEFAKNYDPQPMHTDVRRLRWCFRGIDCQRMAHCRAGDAAPRGLTTSRQYAIARFGRRRSPLAEARSSWRHDYCGN